MKNMQSVTQHRTQIYLPEDLYRIVKERAQKEEKSLAEIVRILLTKQFKKEDSKKARDKKMAWQKFLKMAGFIKSGYSDISTNHDKYLAEDEVASWKRK